MIDLPQLGQLFFDHLVHPGILQTDGIEQAHFALGNTGCGVAETGIFGGALQAHGAQKIQIIIFGKLIAEAKSAAGGDDGVIQLPIPQFHSQSAHSNFTSLLSITGPSTQMRLLPTRVSQLQPMQAPKPQPIRSSKESWPGLPQACTARSMGMGPQAK